MGYPWPGNVRELNGALEFAFVIAEDGLIDLDQLPPQIAEPARMSRQYAADQVEFGVTWKDQLPPADSPEKTALVEALKKTNGNQSQAARILGINRVTVWNRMKKYDIDLKKVLTRRESSGTATI